MLAQEPLHGYEIVEKLGQPHYAPSRAVRKTAVYYALGRLHSNGLVTRHTERNGNRPERAVYTITDPGRESLYAALKATLADPPTQADFDAALLFADNLEPEETAACIDQRRASLKEKQAALEEAMERAAEDGERTRALVLQHRLVTAKNEVGFLSKLQSTLREGGDGALGRHKAGRIEHTPVHELMRNLAAGNRTGSLRLMTAPGHEAHLLFDHGRLSGIVPPADLSVDDALGEVFSASGGDITFDSIQPEGLEAIELQGLLPTILRGCRCAKRPPISTRVMPGPEDVLDVGEPTAEHLELTLTDDESALLLEADGVRSVAQIGRRLGWALDRMAKALYPLWATGFVLRADPGKSRCLAVAIGRLTQFEHAAAAHVDAGVLRRVFHETARRAADEGLPDLNAALSDLAQVRFRCPGMNLDDALEAYLATLREVATSTLSDRLVRGSMDERALAGVQDALKRLERLPAEC
jgi:DNA-binding PadR family transcriptional regulator